VAYTVTKLADDESRQDRRMAQNFKLDGLLALSHGIYR
jgi:hypothetical protein